MTDPTRVSAATGIPTPVDDGTPAGLPTPAGEPSAPDISDPSPETLVASNAHRAIGALVLAWGALEAATTQKLMVMRRIFGDVRAVGGRSRPSLQRLLAELRALAAMRDRHDKHVLTVIAAIDADLQRIAQFRGMILDGTQAVQSDALLCHDLKNVEHRVSVSTVAKETLRIEAITRQIAAL